MQRGFSLVELSIVLVILGLLTGGILAGQSLIRASELRAVSTEYQRYVTAAQTFRDKYLAIPGDFSSATRFWTRQSTAADCVTNSSASVSTPGACDGNGNGITSSCAAGGQSCDSFQIWRHLALAGLIEGTYSGSAGAGGVTHTVLGTNAPASKLSNVGWYAGYNAPGFAGGAIAFAGDYYNYFTVGSVVTNEYTYGASFKPEEVWNIDTKLDDGKAGTGKVLAGRWDDCTDAASGAVTSANYLLTSSSNLCSIYFIQAF